jgi:alpha-beta hydrolase superfamily lysophospholipase
MLLSGFGTAVRMARAVVTPAVRRADTRILAIDPERGAITLTTTADTVLPGRYGLFTGGTLDYLQLGPVLSQDEERTIRELQTPLGDQDTVGQAAAFSGWYYHRPEELGIPFHSDLIPSAVGPCPAWLFPVDNSDVWCVLIHGRGTTRAECLRAVPVLHARGITCLVISYRNDGEAPRSRTGRYGLGDTEWRDADAAVGVARRSGARRILLMGWSMGGAIALQVALRSAHRDRIAGVVLDSPVIDWSDVLRFQGVTMRLPAPVISMTLQILAAEWGAAILRMGAPIGFDRLDVVAHAEQLRAPVLILHSEDDGFVPITGSAALAEARPDLVRLERFDTARHTKLWNYDEGHWSAAIETWLDEHDLAVGST